MPKRRISKRKYKQSIHIDKLNSCQFSKLSDGRNILKLIVERGRLDQWFTNKNNKQKSSVIIHSVGRDINRLFKSDSHFCFVDTNKLSDSLDADSNYTHITGYYIFTVKEFKEDDIGASITTNYENSIIGMLKIDARSTDKPERIGWSYAINALKEMGAKKAVIFVDSEQNELAILNKDLPSGYEFCYVSADHGDTIYNTIFTRLDKLIKITARHESVDQFHLYRVIDYLWGNIDHLDK